MSILEDSATTAKMYTKLGELREKKREFIMQAGVKAYDLFKRGEVENADLHKLADDITNMNNAIQVAAQEAKLDKKREAPENTPQWKIIMDNLIFKLLNTAERMEAKQRYEGLVARGQEYLEDAGKIAMTMRRNHREIEAIAGEIHKIDKELTQISNDIDAREKKGEAGIGLLVSIISFFTSFTNFFKKTKL